MCPKEQTLLNFGMFFTHKCFYIGNLNLNTEKSNKTARDQQYQCVWWVFHQSNMFLPTTFELCTDKETEHVDKAVQSSTLCTWEIHNSLGYNRSM